MEGTVKSFALVAVLAATVTEIFPVVAPVGTDVVMEVVVLAETTAVTPLKRTVLLVGVVLKLLPVMVTVVPMLPDVGVNDVMVGTATEPQTRPDGVSPVMVQLLVMSKLVLAATALVPYCLPLAPSALPFGVDEFALQPINVAE